MSSEALVPIMELVFSQMLAQESYFDLLSHYLPIVEKMANLPEHLRASLMLASQAVLHDLRGSENFDDVLSSLNDGSKDVILRIFFMETNRNGKAVITNLQNANDALARRSNKRQALISCKLELSTIDPCADMSKFIATAKTALNCGLEEGDLLANNSMVASVKDIAELIVQGANKAVEQCDFQECFSFMESDEAIPLDTSIMFLSSEVVKNVESMSTFLKTPGLAEFFENCSKSDVFTEAARRMDDMSQTVSWPKLISMSNLPIYFLAHF